MQLLKAMSAVYDQMQLLYEIHVSKVNQTVWEYFNPTYPNGNTKNITRLLRASQWLKNEILQFKP
jgi:uncharacterized protein HemX